MSSAEIDTVSDQIENWQSGAGPKTLGGLIEVFEERAFAVIFILLLGVPALPLPTGGATHVFEIVAMLGALQLIAGRDHPWLPDRFKRIRLEGDKQQKFVKSLLRVIRFLERFSRPRLTFLFDHRLSNAVFGLLILGLAIAAFVAPPFTGLDTLPSLGAVLISVGVLLRDIAIVIIGVVVGAAGVLLEIVLGKAAVSGISNLFS
jgi:hypothetical protein